MTVLQERYAALEREEVEALRVWEQVKPDWSGKPITGMPTRALPDDALEACETAMLATQAKESFVIDHPGEKF
ncbi:MAG TPA: hypothetical protein VGL75_00480 [Acidothermaceae bacterium]|jgi:hypothetical protein